MGDFNEWFSVQEKLSKTFKKANSQEIGPNCEVCGGSINPIYKERFCKCRRKLLNVAWKIYDLATDFHELRDQLEQLSLKDRVELESELFESDLDRAKVTCLKTSKGDRLQAADSSSSDPPSSSPTASSSISVEHYQIPRPRIPLKKNTVIARETRRESPKPMVLKLPRPPAFSVNKIKQSNEIENRQTFSLPPNWSPLKEGECLNIDGYIWAPSKSAPCGSNYSDSWSTENSSEHQLGYIKTPPVKLELSSNCSYVAPLKEHHVVFLPNNRMRARQLAA